MNKVIEKAFTSLSKVCNTSALHVSDEDRIKVTLKTLYKKDVSIDVTSLEEWLHENGWGPKSIKSVIVWADAVSNGKRVQLKNKAMAPTEKQVWEKLCA